jgi:hypothetical protein
LLNFTSLHSNNNLVNSLLYLNKTAQEKYKIDFITYNEFLKILKKDQEKFLSEIFKNVTEHHNLFIHEKEIIPKSISKLVITIKNNKKRKKFQLKIEKEKPEGEADENNHSNKDLHEKNSTDEDIFQRINFDYESADYFYIDLEDILTISPENSQHMLQHLVNYMELITVNNKKLKIILSYSNLLNQTKALNLKTVEAIINIFSFSDILIFEKKDVYSLFNLIYQIKESEGSENLKTLHQIDLNGYICKTLNFVRKINKVCLFLDDFQEITILEISSAKRKIIIEKTKTLDLYPKINHTNQKLIEEYKRILSIQYIFFRSVFFGTCLSKYLENVYNKESDKKEKLKIYFSSYLAGKEITKRILEATRKNLELPLDKEFYQVKISSSMVDKAIENDKTKNKEDQFILDCTNQRSSRLKYYHPLYDGHLNLFFSSEMNRKQLKEKGFINTNGFIMYDGIYRDVMGPSPKRKNESEVEKKIYVAYKNNSFGEDSNEKLMESFKRMKVSNSPTDRKLPKLKFEYLQGGSQSKKRKFRLKPIKKNNMSNLYVNSCSNVNDSKLSQMISVDSSQYLDKELKMEIDLFKPKQNFENEDEQIQDDS